MHLHVNLFLYLNIEIHEFILIAVIPLQYHLSFHIYNSFLSNQVMDLVFVILHVFTFYKNNPRLRCLPS